MRLAVFKQSQPSRYHPDPPFIRPYRLTNPPVTNYTVRPRPISTNLSRTKTPPPHYPRLAPSNTLRTFTMTSPRSPVPHRKNTQRKSMTISPQPQATARKFTTIPKLLARYRHGPHRRISACALGRCMTIRPVRVQSVNLVTKR